MDVLGPTNYDMVAPSRPDFEMKRIDNNQDVTWLSELTTDESFTAEFNFKINNLTDNGLFRVVFSYENEENFGYASVDFTNHKLTLYQVKDGREQFVSDGFVPEEFDFTKLHTIRIENTYDKIAVFLDGMKKIDVNHDQFNKGKIGYYVENLQADLEYTAFSNHVESSSDFEVYKPIPGSIEAIHYLEGKNRGYHIKNQEQETTYRKDVPVTLNEGGTYSVRLSDKGDWLKYKVNVKEDGLYGVSAVINPHSKEGNSKLDFSIENGEGQTFKLQQISSENETDPVKVHLGSMRLEKGLQVLKVALIRGDVDLERFEIYKITEDEINIKQGLNEVGIDDIHGNWLLTEDGYQSNVNEDMKLYLGNDNWTDLEAEISFEINDSLMNRAGLLIRATNESNFEHQVKDSLMGYYISFSQREIALHKLNYDSTLLKAVAFSFTPGKEYRLRVTVQNSVINVFIDEQKKPILTFYDPNAFMYGKVGIRSEYSDIYFKDLSVKSIAE
jgi:xylan 1,4-beta-xylosidase